MEVTIANRLGSTFSVVEPKKDRAKVKKNIKFFKSLTKEAMMSFKAEPVQITKKPNSKEKRSVPFKDTIRRRPTLKELQEKKYLFPNSNLLGMLDDHLEKGVV